MVVIENGISTSAAAPLAAYDLERPLAALIAGTALSWPAEWRDGGQTRAFLSLCERHAVKALVGFRLQYGAIGQSAPADIRQVAAAWLHEAVVVEECRRGELARVMAALYAARIRAVLLKGAALAYTHYDAPYLRPRIDMDFILPEHQRDEAGRVLARLGYAKSSRSEGTLLFQQARYERQQGAHEHLIDLHWKVLNAHEVADFVSFDEIEAEAVRVPGLGAEARAASPEHALLVACVHRVVHHQDDGKLLWLYDIHLLADRLDAAAFDRLAAIAVERGVAAPCARSLSLARVHFGTRVPDGAIRMLGRSGGDGLSVYMNADARPVDLLLADLNALPGWRARLHLVREHLFPPARYVLAAYGAPTPLLLPFLYLHRIAAGARRWFRPVSR